MDHAVILGATGRLGRALVDEFQRRIPLVTAVSRSPVTPSGPHNVRWVRLDPGDVWGHRHLFRVADVVIDARNQRYDDWSGYPAMVNATLEALKGVSAHYIYVDNIYCYGRSPSPLVLVNESAPRNPISKKGRFRVVVEQRLYEARDQGQSITIVRFPDFYDIATDPLPQGSLRWFGPPELAHQFIYRPDAAYATWFIANDPQSMGSVWHVAGDNPITGLAIHALAQEVAKRPIKFAVFSPRLIAVMGLVNFQARGLKETQYLWSSPLILDTAKFDGRYGRHFIHGHKEVLQELLGSFTQPPSGLGRPKRDR